MLSSLQPRGGRRWPRGQRFQLTEAGLAAEAARAETVRETRAMGRAALEAAGLRWAAPLGIEPRDGVVLSELKPGRRSLADLARELEVCGPSRSDVKESIDRLVERGLAEPMPAAA